MFLFFLHCFVAILLCPGSSRNLGVGVLISLYKKVIFTRIQELQLNTYKPTYIST